NVDDQRSVANVDDQRSVANVDDQRSVAKEVLSRWLSHQQ
ncbi:32720_t:CDS:1, partial [Racocetra persica]